MNNVNICSHQVTINKALQSFNLLIRIPESLIFKAVQTEARQPSLPGTQSPASEGAPDSVRRKQSPIITRHLHGMAPNTRNLTCCKKTIRPTR